MVLNQKREAYSPFEIIFYYSEEYFYLIFTVFVIVRTFEFIREKEREIKRSQRKVLIQTDWLKKLLFVGVLICIFWLCLTGYSQISRTGQFNTNYRYILWLSISFLIHWLGYLGVYHVLVFNQRVSLGKNGVRKKKEIAIDHNSKIEKVTSLIER